jgi:hypothetical protein
VRWPTRCKKRAAQKKIKEKNREWVVYSQKQANKTTERGINVVPENVSPNENILIFAPSAPLTPIYNHGKPLAPLFTTGIAQQGSVHNVNAGNTASDYALYDISGKKWQQKILCLRVYGSIYIKGLTLFNMSSRKIK